MMAFRYAVSQGVTGIEVDVQMTKDDRIVVFHDGICDRVLEGSGRVKDYTFAELQAMPYKRCGNIDVKIDDGGWDVSEELNERSDRVPSIEQLILFAKRKGLKLFIELKEVRKTIKILHRINELWAKYDLYDTCVLCTFNPYHLFVFRLLYSKSNILTCMHYCTGCIEWYNEEKSEEMKLPGPLDCKPVRWIADQLLFLTAPYLAEFIGVDMVGIWVENIARDRIKWHQERGCAVNCWTVNTELEKKLWQSHGVIVTTDFMFKDANGVVDSALKRS
jgi:glycerophosphoryl diester phosphodiesterase